MLSATRNFAKSWAARVLMGLLVLAMAGFGISRYGFTAIKGDEVVRAGSRTITSNEFRREYDNFKKRAEQQQGQPISLEAAEQNHLDTVVLNGLATREAFFEVLSHAGLKPSDKLLLAQVEKIPAFFDPITGRFDKKTFQGRLAENGMTPAMFDTILRDDTANTHWEVAVQHGLTVPRAYGALASVFALETRDLSYFVITPQSVPQPASPTDPQLTQFIKENNVKLPETRQITVVLFNPAAAQAAVAAAPIDPAELQKRYNFRKDTLSKPETRTVVQIPVKDAAAAQAVTTRLRAGEAPAAVAKSLGVDAVTYDEKPLTAIADRKVGAAAFKMQAGEIGAVQGDLGLAVVKVVSVTEGREVSLEAARPMLEAEIRKDMAAEKVYAQTQAYDDAHQGGASLTAAAQKAGATAQTLPPITAQGQVGFAGRMNIPPKILESAFALPAGGDSEVTDLGDGASFAVHVDKIIPAHVPPLDEIRPMITQAWLRRELARALEAKATALTQRIQKGETIEAAGASAGYPVIRIPDLSRQTAQPHQQDLGPQVLGRAFGSATGEIWTAPAPAGIAVGRIASIHMEPGPTAARLAESNRRDLTVAVFREMDEAAHSYARAKLKVKMDPARARAAAGFEPEEKGDKGKKAAKK